MQKQAFDWHATIMEVGARREPLYALLQQGRFTDLLQAFRSGGNNPYQSLALYWLYGAAAILGRSSADTEQVLAYQQRLNEKTRAITLFFWSEEATQHSQHRTAEGLAAPLLEVYPHDPEVNALIARCGLFGQDLTRGWASIKAGLASAPDHLLLLGLKARYQMRDGDMEAARATAERLLALEPDDLTAFTVLSRTSPEALEPEALDRFEALAASDTLGPVPAAGLYYDLGRVLDARGDYAAAFVAIDKANSCMRAAPEVAQHRFNREQEYEGFAAQRRLLSGLKPLQAMPALTPIFIIGLPRTGSTLLDQALSAHPEVTSLGENEHIGTIVAEAEALLEAGRLEEAQASMQGWQWRYMAAAKAQDPSARFVVDKTLGNSRHLGFLARLFPGARFLHARRDPLDVGLSIYFAPLPPAVLYATRLESIADFIAVDDAIVAAWTEAGLDPLPVDYEATVEDMEGVLRRVCDHIGLAFDPVCLKFYESKRAVHTYSAHQVRQPLYQRSKGRSRHYEAQLAPLKAALQDRGIAAAG